MLTAADFLYVGLIFVWAVILDVVTFENKLYVVMILWVGLTYIISNSTSLELVIKVITFSLLVAIYVEVALRMLGVVRNWLRLPPRNWHVRNLRLPQNVAVAA